MKFYDCASAPSPRRIRIFIAEKNLQIPVVDVDLANQEQHTDAFVRINPQRTVPVLELDDGSRLTSTHGIQHYLEYTFPEPALIGRNAAELGNWLIPFQSESQYMRFDQQIRTTFDAHINATHVEPLFQKRT